MKWMVFPVPSAYSTIHSAKYGPRGVELSKADFSRKIYQNI